MISFNSDVFRIEGTFISDIGKNEQAGIGVSRDNKIALSRNNIPVASLASWFGHTPVVSFSPEDLNLIYGSPLLRRQFCDMILCATHPDYLPALIAYRHALQNRNHCLTNGADGSLLDTYEELMAAHGWTIALCRFDLSIFLKEQCAANYMLIAPLDQAISIDYKSSPSSDFSSAGTWKNVFLTSLQKSRLRDSSLGQTFVGPHRDDLICRLDNRLIREFGSQGQCRSFALALRLSSVRFLKASGISAMVFLVDDAFAELDDERVKRLYPLLVQQGQLFIATPAQKPEGIDLAMRLKVSSGEILAL